MRRAAVVGAVLAGLGAVAVTMEARWTPPAIALCVMSPWLARLGRRLPWAPLTLLVLTSLVLWGWVAGVEPALALALGYLALQRLLARRHRGDDRVAVLIGGLLLTVAASLSSLLGLLPCLVLFMVCAPLALGVGRPRPALSLAVPLAALPLFWLLPRVSAPVQVAPGSGLTGFSGDLELGAMDVLLDDPTRVFEASFPVRPTEPVYFRGVALDRFDGRLWWAEGDRVREPDYKRALPDLTAIEVELASHTEQVLFVAGTVTGLDADGVAVERDGHGAYHLPGPPRAVRYTIYGRGPWGEGRLDPYQGPASTAVPPLSGAVLRRFREAAGEGTVQVRMERLKDWLTRSYTYSRSPRDSEVEAPLEAFLMESRKGHCEYFASALAVGGRVVGVPTRVVNGFVGGEPEGPRSLVFRRYHAHSWVEYYDATQGGWVTADATPAIGAPATPGLLVRTEERLDRAWRSAVVDFDASTQVGIARATAARAGGWLPGVPAVPAGAAVMASLSLLAGLLARRLWLIWGARAAGETQAAPGDPVSRAHRWALQRLARRGLAIPRSLPPVDGARWVAEREPAAGEALERLAWLMYGVRYGGDDPTKVQAEAWQLARAAARRR